MRATCPYHCVALAVRRCPACTRSPHTFVPALSRPCVDAQRSLEDPDGDDSMFVQIMLAVVEFEVFMQMMREAKLAKEAAASKK